MVESLQVSAQLTTVVEVDVTKIARLRDRAKRDFQAREGVKLSFLPFFALAVVEALKIHPMVNASIDGDEITYHGSENLGIAVDTERGLLVPVIKDAGDLNIAGLARKIADLAERTRTNKIGPDELGGGTFTLTNTGSRGRAVRHPDHQPAAGRDPRHRRGRQAAGRRRRRGRRRDDRDPLDGLPGAVLRPPARRRRRRGAVPVDDQGAARGRRVRVRPRASDRAAGQESRRPRRSVLVRVAPVPGQDGADGLRGHRCLRPDRPRAGRPAPRGRATRSGAWCGRRARLEPGDVRWDPAAGDGRPGRRSPAWTAWSTWPAPASATTAGPTAYRRDDPRLAGGRHPHHRRGR